MPTERVCTIWSQHGPACVTLKYCKSTLAEIAEGGTCMCVSVRPGSARLTSSPTYLPEQSFTDCGVFRMTCASPIGEFKPKIQRDLRRQRESMTSPDEKFVATAFR